MSLEIHQADYRDPADAKALIKVLDAYARDPFGGSAPLSDFAKSNLADNLATLPHASTFLAFYDQEPVGIANCFLGFSTFKCQPLLNIHDFAVLPTARRKGVGLALLEAVEAFARNHDCCKITLEVLRENHPAKHLYQKFGFEGYALDPSHGEALFWEKPLPES